MSVLSRRLGPLGVAALVLDCSACPRSPPGAGDATPVGALQAPEKLDIAESIYDNGLKNGWEDGGWAPRDVGAGKGPAKVRFSDDGAWILSKRGLSGDFGGVVFFVKEPPGEGEFLELRVESSAQAIFPRIKISPDHRTDVGDGWTKVFVSMSELDPGAAPFDRIVLRAFRSIGNDWVLLDKIGLLRGTGATASASGAAGAPRPAGSYDPAILPHVNIAIDCRAKATKISPYIYGIAFYAFNDEKRQKEQWLLDATARRWGGNTASTYNWEINTWNTGNDWYFENHGVGSYKEFFQANAEHNVASALTVPIMGWVSKDDSSSSFPVSAFGPQDSTDQWRPDAGNGKGKDGKLIEPGPQSRAYVRSTPEFVKRWVQAIRKDDAATGKRSVYMYILDNEPAIWGTTHRDAHPEPESYDELVQRSIDYGTVIRQADPDAIIAGPAEWGWTGYMYSGKDMAMGGPAVRPDRRAHGDMPVIAYYLKALAESEKKTGVRVLDVLDLHGYAYADGVSGSEEASPEVAARRIRATRMMWDPTYVDESWVKEPVKLLPRMREWIDQNYPGRGMSIGEWNFGGEGHMSGALATAETLGRYAQFGLTSAYYWSYPPADSPVMWAFRAYRNFDGKGGRFLDWYSATTPVQGASLFVSRDDSGNHMVAVALNFSPQNAIAANVDLSSCGAVASVKAYSYGGGTGGFKGVDAPFKAHDKTLLEALSPYTITVFDIELENAVAVSK
jgi:Glycoside hydrolase family 44